MASEAPGRKDEFELYKERITNFSQEFELGLFLYIGRKSLPWILGILLLAGIGSYLYLRYTIPIYESSVLLQLGEEDRAKQLLNVNNVYEEDEKLSADLEVLRSNFLLKRALKRLPLRVRYFAEGNFLTNEHYVRSPYRVRILSISDSSLIGEKIGIEAREDDKVQLSYSTPEGEFEQSFSTRKPVETPHFRIRFRKFEGEKLLENQGESDHFFSFTSNAGLAEDLQNNLNVEVSNSQAKTIKISYRGPNKVMTRDVAMAMAREYIDYDLERKKKSSKKTLEFIETQLDTVRESLQSSEIRLQRFKKEHEIREGEEISDVHTQRLAELEDKVVGLELKENMLEEVRKAMDQDVDQLEVDRLIPMISGSELSNTSLTRMVRSLQDLLVEREESRFQMTEKNAGIASIEHQIRIQKRMVKESVGSILEKTRDRRKKLEEKIRDYEERYFDLPEQKIEFARLQRVFKINEKYYTLLLEKKTEHSISQAGFVPQNEILEKAKVPKRPLRPRPRLTVVTFLLFGLVISFLLVVLRYLLHDQITSLNEITRMTQASVGILGIIPRYKKPVPQNQLLVDQNPKSLIAESFRGVRSNLQFMSEEEGSSLAGVTSTVSGEGKTFFAINLAGIYALMGKKVLLLDLDMRKPKIHEGFGLSNEKGMSTVLIGRDQVEEALHESQLDKLHVLPAGPAPPNPSELILSERMDEVLEQLGKEYDLIVVDTPPVGLVTDGLEIIKRADLPIYLFRAEFSKKRFVQNVDRLINENGIRKLSVVLNGVDPERGVYGYDYGYGYGYGYAYGYGDDYYNEDKGRRRSWFKRLFR